MIRGARRDVVTWFGLIVSSTSCGRIDFAPVGANLSYRAVVVADEPVGYWRLDDSGPIAHDEMAHMDGTFSGTCTQGVPGLIDDADPATLFDGTSCFVMLGNELTVLGTAPYSIEAWVSQRPGGADFQNIVSREARTAAGPADGYALLVAPLASNSLYFERAIGSQNQLTMRQSVASGTIIHAVAVYTGAEMQMWKDGVLVAAQADARPMGTYPAPTLIGAAMEGGLLAPWNGVIDEVALYDKELTPAQIHLHHEVGISRRRDP